MSKIFNALRYLLYRRISVPAKYLRWNIKANRLYFFTMLLKKCSYGPFTGEFGHLLGHNLPFLTYLHSKGVKVKFCGMDIYRPFFIDENNKEIVTEYLELPDFFDVSEPDCNSANEPEKIEQITKQFISNSKISSLPFWDNSNQDYYFYFFRQWVLKKKYYEIYDLSKVYKTLNENSVVIFPKKLNNVAGRSEKEIQNQGEVWDYLEIAKTVAKHVSKVYVIGHPVFSKVEFESFDNVEVCFTTDNKFILEKCCNSKLIICIHSGTVYLGAYANTQVLIIYKGGREIGEIEDTKQFNKALTESREFDYAYSLDEIDNYLKKI